jgi:hypothetical protein
MLTQSSNQPAFSLSRDAKKKRENPGNLLSRHDALSVVMQQSFLAVLGPKGKRPAANEVPIPDRNGHYTAGWDGLVIEKIIEIRFLGRTITGGTVGSLSG